MTDRGHTVRIDGRDGDVSGLEVSEQEELMRQDGVSNRRSSRGFSLAPTAFLLRSGDSA